MPSRPTDPDRSEQPHAAPAHQACATSAASGSATSESAASATSFPTGSAASATSESAPSATSLPTGSAACATSESADPSTPAQPRGRTAGAHVFKLSNIHVEASQVRQALAPRCASHLLLETADLVGTTSTSSMIAYAPLAYARCTDLRVEVESCEPSGIPTRAHAAFRKRAQDLLNHVATSLQAFVTQVDHARVCLEFPPSTHSDEARRLREPNPLDVLRALSTFITSLSGLPPHVPVVAGAFGFDFIDSFEQLPPVQKSQDFADFEFLVPARVLAFDHRKHSASIVGLMDMDEDEAADLKQLLYAQAPSDLSASALPSGSETKAAAETAAEPKGETAATAVTGGDAHTIQAVPNVRDEDFIAAVINLQNHIQAGDIFQVVPSRTFRLPCPDPAKAYAVLREVNPSPYMFYFAAKHATVFGASPESCLKFDAPTRQVCVHPIAGTRPRKKINGSYNHESDVRTELSLRLDAKETAEHVMLVDLARNDLARIAVPGSRHVSQLLGVEHYSHVSHLVSTVNATLADGLDALDAYRACMNMGTLTGAPKIEATRLIRATEQGARGLYGGAVGYLAADGSFDSCIVIRSALVTDATAHVTAGAGVVADSVAESEANETRFKASAVLDAIAQSQHARLEVAR
ncbi:MAG: anthranilate synthase component 1 [Actinomycetaceae bacterium]|nr:anthranilate synthase component 1 [Actinomycetaceae bacterium]